VDAAVSRVTPVVNVALVVVVMISVGSYAAGLSALSNGIRTVWLVLGGVFGFTAIRGLVRLRWNLTAIRRHRNDIAAELLDLHRLDPATGSTVIEMIERTDDEGAGVYSTQFGYSGRSTQFGAIGRTLDGSIPGTAPWLTRLVSTARRGVVAVLVAMAITAIFALLGLIFLVALAL
jgi:hypothetical protein